MHNRLLYRVSSHSTSYPFPLSLFQSFPPFFAFVCCVQAQLIFSILLHVHVSKISSLQCVFSCSMISMCRVIQRKSPDQCFVSSVSSDSCLFFLSVVLSFLITSLFILLSFF